MPKKPRYLITSSDERTWKLDRPVIFLGEWCRLYDRKHIWQKMDAIVAEPYGLGKSAKDADHANAQMLEKKLFPILCNALNQHHGTHYGERFWLIVIGHWLRRYTIMILNRVNTFEQCLRSYELNGTTSFSADHYTFAIQDTSQTSSSFNDDRWNNLLYIRILNLLGVKNCPVEVIAEDEPEGFHFPATTTKGALKQRILKWGLQQAMKITTLLVRENDAFIINSYLPPIKEIKLQLGLGQVPQSWTLPKFESTKKPDHALRKKLSYQIASKSNDTLFDIMCELVFELLPVCFLEGFSDMSEKVKQLPWPEKPKFIFTSNNFDTDELFKLWAAKKVECGYKYIIGQHGNNYGTFRYMYPSIEEVTADKFLTWGWTDGLPQHTPAFIFKTAGRKAENYNPNGGLLLMEICIHHRIFSWDSTDEFLTYFQDQQIFIDKLEKKPKENLTVRLYSLYRQLKWNEESRWKEFDPELKIDTGDIAIRKLITQSRLLVYSYDSTGLLESLSQNIPTLAFWQNDFNHLRENAKPYYQLLVDAGIVHLTAKSAASKVNEVWNNVEEWWLQPAVQKIRKQFCDRYSRVSQKPVSDLKKILLK
jgi:putative transferase (TIGR04331 family)